MLMKLVSQEFDSLDERNGVQSLIMTINYKINDDIYN